MKNFFCDKKQKMLLEKVLTLHLKKEKQGYILDRILFDFKIRRKRMVLEQVFKKKGVGF